MVIENQFCKTGAPFTACQEVQATTRLKLLASVKVHKAGPYYWLTADWTDWYQMKKSEPTEQDRETFCQAAFTWGLAD